MMAQLKTVVLLGALTGLFLLIGMLVGGGVGLTIGFMLALIVNFIAYWYSDKIVLGLYRAKPLSESEAPSIHSMVEEIAKKAGIPKPKLYIVESATPNAFATGRSPKHSAVAVTTGILQLLNEEELKGVLAHEIAHIKNRDTLISTIAAVIAGTIAYIAFLARWAAIFGGFGRDENSVNLVELLFLALLAPLIATLIRLGISRSREFLADETGARFIGHGKPLANALAKLEYGVQRRPMVDANKGTSHMFIVNPFGGAGGLIKLFSTHPPTEERIARLERMKF
jgi:heat shock protein HtpX